MSVPQWRAFFDEKGIAVLPIDIEDINAIRLLIPELAGAPARHIHNAWRAFSDDRCASYLIVNDEDVKEFREWLELD